MVFIQLEIQQSGTPAKKHKGKQLDRWFPLTMIKKFISLIKTPKNAFVCHFLKSIFFGRCKSGSLRKQVIHTVISPALLYQLLIPLVETKYTVLINKVMFSFCGVITISILFTRHSQKFDSLVNKERGGKLSASQRYFLVQ